ncbi:MAG: hypothetical protein PUF50_02360 [Erysipelotrichaceae bacterium]|nr:hypothetical protein [Erysipelotrichaceae bacterium]
MASEIIGRTPKEQLNKMGVNLDSLINNKAQRNSVNDEFDADLEKGIDIASVDGLRAALINRLREVGNDVISFSKTLSQNFDTIAGKDVKLRSLLRATIEDPLDDAKKNMFTDMNEMLIKVSSISKKYGIKKGSKESAAVQWYGEGTKDTTDPNIGEYTLEMLKAEFPSKWKAIVDCEKEIRPIYNGYIDKINESRMKIYPNVMEKAYEDLANAQIRVNKYEQRIANAKINNVYDSSFIKNQQQLLERAKADVERIQKAIENGDYTLNKVLSPRSDYFHHFQDISDFQGNIMAMLKNNTDYKISNKLSGISEGTAPKAKYTGFMQHRGYGKYNADAIGGLIKYIPAAEYACNVDPFVAQLRGIVKAIRDTSDVDETSLSYTVNYLTQYANHLAGKTFMLDRIITDILPGGRKVLKYIKAINNRVKANAILGNMRSAISQFYNLPVGLSMISNPASMVKGTKMYAQYLMGNQTARDIMNQSIFLKERYFDNVYENLDLNDDGPIKQKAMFVMQFGDEVVSRNIWFGAYAEAISKKMSSQEAIKYADNLTRNAVAGRGIGEVPLMQQSELIKLLAPFQVEVNNQWQYFKKLSHDIISGSSDEKKRAAWQMFVMFAVTWGMNELRERYLDGNRTVMDLIDAFSDAFNNYDSDENIVSNVASGTGRVAGELLSNVPYAAQLMPLMVSDSTRESFFGDADPTRFGTGNIGVNALLAPFIRALQGENLDINEIVFSLLTPYGGKQADRTLSYMQDRGWVPNLNIDTENGIRLNTNEVAGSYSDNGRLRYALNDDSILETVRGILFGSSGTQAAREYYDKSKGPLSDSKTDAYVNARKAGATYQQMKGVMDEVTTFKSDKDIDGKSISYSKGKKTADYIDGLNMNDKAKETLYKAYALSDSQRAIYDKCIANGATYSQMKKALFDIGIMESIKDSNGKSIANSKSVRIAKYINDMNVNENVKQLLRNEFVSKTVRNMSDEELSEQLNSGSSRSSSKSKSRKIIESDSAAKRIRNLLSNNSSSINAELSNKIKKILNDFNSSIS